MESFYGGLPGQSFIIRKTYPSVDSMKTAFIHTETDVWYEDYVLIDTPNKNNEDNGKIYKRLSGRDEDTCCEYIGQIVGPASGTPWIIGSPLNTTTEGDSGELLLQMKEALKQYPSSDSDYVDFGYLDENNVLIHKSGENFKIDNDGILQIKTGSETYKNVVVQQQEFEGLDFVPGYSPADPTIPGSTEIYHDTIKWGWCNIRTKDNNNDSMYYIGFQIPYPVFELSGEWVSGYDVDGNKRLSLDVFAYDEAKGRNHKFYYPYKIEMPNSRIPYAVRNIRHVQYADIAGEDSVVYLPESFKFVWDTTMTPPDWKFILYEDQTDFPKILDLSYLNSTYNLGFNLSTEDAEEIAGESTEIWVYDLYIYEDYLEKEPELTKIYTVFAGLYNVISAYPSIKLVREAATKQELITLVSQQPSEDKSTLIYKNIFSFFSKDINKNPYELPVLWGDVL